MKIATYNVWNDNSNIDIRTERLIQEIININADVIGLQEVIPEFWEPLIKNIDYKYHIFRMFRNRSDGLAILSKYPFESDFFLYDSEEFQNSLALNITFKKMGMNFSVTNVHLPWDSIIVKEKQIVAINEYTSMQNNIDYLFLLGDFNCSYQSSVHNFLAGEQTLLNCEVGTGNDIWCDLAEIHAALNGYNVIPTLDFTNNPRFKETHPKKYIPVAYDRIYLMDKATDNKQKLEYKIENVRIFGTDVSPETKLSPSDHYGLLAEVDFY
jgi:endonuclease/exonuclease/phosphatase family metal-dependent hydrolase